MTQLAALGATAQVLPAIMEGGGLTASDDFQRFDKIDALNKLGKRDEAMAYFKQLQWQPMGMTKHDILARFSWASCSDNGLGAPGEQIPTEGPWWLGGYESSKRSAARVGGVAAWMLGELRALAAEDALVVCVCHGGTIALLTNLLLGAAFAGDNNGGSDALPREDTGVSFDGIRNTSVTSFLLPGIGGPPSAGAAGAKPVGYCTCKLEFFNDASHLGMALSKSWAAEYLRAKL